MPLLIIFGLVILLGIFAPGLANTLAWLITIAFTIPFFTFIGGTFAWAIINLCTSGTYFSAHGWLGCCAFIGFPAGLVAAYWTLSD